MKTTHVLLLTLAVAVGRLSAQDPAPPAAEKPAEASAAPKSEMQKWIEATDAQWQDAFKKGVTDVHEAEMNKVKVQYLTLLEDGINKASKAGDLKGAVALRDEQKRFAETQMFPEQDDAADAASVKQLRAVIRAQLAKANSDRATRAKGLHAKYDQTLAQVQAQLTQANRLDDALLVQAKREEVAAAWLAGLPATPAPAASEPPKVATDPKPSQPAARPVVAAAPKPESSERNLLQNPNFEQGTDAWTFSSWAKKGAMSWDEKELRNGKPTVRIENVEGDDSQLLQAVAAKPNTRYRLSGWIKTKNIEAEKRGGKNGATLAVNGSFATTTPLTHTKGWTRVTMDYVTGKETQVRVGPRLGHNGGNVLGTAWFSELSLIEVGRAPK